MRTPRLLLTLGLALAVAGCDTSDVPDAERIVGTWTPASFDVVVAGAVPVPLASIDGDGALVVTSGGGFELALALGGEVDIPNTDVTVELPAEVDLTGTYALDDAAETIAVTSGTGTATFGYNLGSFLGSEETLRLEADSPEELVALLDLELEDAQAFFRVASGGSVRFRRATN